MVFLGFVSLQYLGRARSTKFTVSGSILPPQTRERKKQLDETGIKPRYSCSASDHSILYSWVRWISSFRVKSKASIARLFPSDKCTGFFFSILFQTPAHFFSLSRLNRQQNSNTNILIFFCSLFSSFSSKIRWRRKTSRIEIVAFLSIQISLTRFGKKKTPRQRFPFAAFARKEWFLTFAPGKTTQATGASRPSPRPSIYSRKLAYMKSRASNSCARLGSLL